MPEEIEARITTSYVCPICEKGYPTREEAARCAARGKEKPIVKVGDIVLARAGFGWFDGSRDWVKNPDVKKHPEHGNCFGECCTMTFYYVVTAIDDYEGDPHRIRYHLLTGAMSEEQGHRQRWTTVDGHYKPRRVKDPPDKVLAESKKFIGSKADNPL
jgi:hypothetical protein